MNLIQNQADFPSEMTRNVGFWEYGLCLLRYIVNSMNSVQSNIEVNKVFSMGQCKYLHLLAGTVTYIELEFNIDTSFSE